MKSARPVLPDVPFVEADAAVRADLIARHPEHAETIRSLHEQGFAVIDPAFAPGDLDTVDAYCRSELKDTDRIQDGWIDQPAIGRLAVHQPVLDLLTALYGRRAFPFQTLNFERGTEQAPHSDTYHFNSTPARFMCGVWIALEDISPDAGPLVYYPGSHKLDIITRAEIGGAHAYGDYERFISQRIAAHGMAPEYGLLKRGQALIWSANLIHGGAARKNPALTRMSQVTHYYFEDCAYHTPLEFDLEQDKPFVRQPYDLSRRRHVLSNRQHLNAQLSWREIWAQRWHLWRQRPSRF